MRTNLKPIFFNGPKMVELGLRKIGEPHVTSDTASAEPRLPTTAASGSAAIAARLQQAILDGSYAYGERLPAERDLAQHFGASRSTVREALKRLEELRLLTRRIGSGTFVSYRPSLDGNNIAEVTSPLELIEVRMALEPRIARLAAVKVTARDLSRMAKALERAEAAVNDREEFTIADGQFHLILAECTHNPLMVWLYQQINDVRNHAQWTRMKDKILTPQRIAEYNREHRQLFEALHSHDVELATRTIEKHLENARRQLVGAGQE